MVVEFPTFCFGISLKRGTALIGFLQSVLSFIFMILCSSYADNPHELVDMSDPSVIPNLNTLKILLIITAVASAMQCIFSILIIFGAETNRPLLLAPWLIFNPITLVVYVIGTLIVIFEHSGINNTAFVVGHLIFGTLNFGGICVFANFTCIMCCLPTNAKCIRFTDWCLQHSDSLSSPQTPEKPKLLNKKEKFI